MGERGRLSATPAQVAEALRRDGQWRGAARALGISPGLAFMIRTGIPADGSGSPALDAGLEERFKLSDPQRLVNPAQHNPTRDARVLAWVIERAGRDLRASGNEGPGQTSSKEGKP